MQTYVEEPRATDIFSRVAVLVYVIDVAGLPADEVTFEACTGALRRHSPDSRLFILLHKADLLPGTGAPPLRELEGRLKRRALPTLATCFYSTIWDESIYRAWATIMASLVPRCEALTSELGRLASRAHCQEAVLFESNTFLAIAHHCSRRGGSAAGGAGGGDGRRWEKISNILKQVRLTTTKFSSTPVSIRLTLEDGTNLLLERVTADALILLVAAGETTLSAELATHVPHFKPILEAVLLAPGEDYADVDPHLLSPH